jgi:heme/copper-type cytochrome/quinol oxidase subunit 4
MAHRHPTLYLLLSLLFLLLTLILIFLGMASSWSSLTRVTLFLLSPFSLILALSYFHLRSQEERGF